MTTAQRKRIGRVMVGTRRYHGRVILDAGEMRTIQRIGRLQKAGDRGRHSRIRDAIYSTLWTEGVKRHDGKEWSENAVRQALRLVAKWEAEGMTERVDELIARAESGERIPSVAIGA